MSTSIRTRFAPSPTGYLHIGGARTALFNYLFARKMGGTFILRIEDTDQERHVEDAMKAIFTSMSWLGLDWDEGEGKGGPCEPYFQSQRKDIYDRYFNKLVEMGRVYECPSPNKRDKNDYEIPGTIQVLEYEQENMAKLQDNAREMLTLLAEAFNGIEEWSGEAAFQVIKPLAKGNGVKVGAAMFPLRMALKGTHASPGIDVIMQVLGREEVQRRISVFLC